MQIIVVRLIYAIINFDCNVTPQSCSSDLESYGEQRCQQTGRCGEKIGGGLEMRRDAGWLLTRSNPPAFKHVVHSLYKSSSFPRKPGCPFQTLPLRSIQSLTVGMNLSGVTPFNRALMLKVGGGLNVRLFGGLPWFRCGEVAG